MFHMSANQGNNSSNYQTQQILISGIFACDEQETICGQKVMRTFGRLSLDNLTTELLFSQQSDSISGLFACVLLCPLNWLAQMGAVSDRTTVALAESERICSRAKLGQQDTCSRIVSSKQVQISDCGRLAFLSAQSILAGIKTL